MSADGDEGEKFFVLFQIAEWVPPVAATATRVRAATATRAATRAPTAARAAAAAASAATATTASTSSSTRASWSSTINRISDDRINTIQYFKLYRLCFS